VACGFQSIARVVVYTWNNFLFFAADKFERWFVFLFMLHIFIGASQERYLLALTPILLLWAVRAWSKVGRWGYRQFSFQKN